MGLQLALREWRAHFADARVLGSMAVVGAILGFSGPFGTYGVLPAVPRLVYWLAMVGATYATGYAVSTVALRAFAGMIEPVAVRLAVLAVVTGVPITAIVVVINLLAFGPEAWSLFGAIGLLVYVTLISLGVMAVATIVASALRRAAQSAPVDTPAGAEAAPPAPPPILERVPLPQRGRLLALSVADHYVEVITDRGRSLVLMRLGDAIRETGGVAGLQIHRSHWVALEAVRHVGRSGGRPVVELSDGSSLPVSRGFLPAARAAGLLG